MNSISLKKSAVAFIVLLAVGSVGFSTAYGYGGGGGGGTKTKVTICHNGNTITVAKSAVAAHLKHGDTRGACATVAAVATPAPFVLGATTSQGKAGQQYLPFLTSANTILLTVQSGNEKGDISNEDAAKLTSQLASVISAIMALFR